MPKESSPDSGLPQISYKYKDEVYDEVKRVIESCGLPFNEEVVRFPKVNEVKEDGQRGAIRSRDFLVVDLARIKRLAKAGEEDQRDIISRGLLRLLGFFDDSAVISHGMEGEDGNKILEFEHPTLPYKAEVLVHNMGRKQYLISGFVISPK